MPFVTKLQSGVTKYAFDELTKIPMVYEVKTFDMLNFISEMITKTHCHVRLSPVV